MAKFQSPLLGYNNNVRHRGRIFHIQTEDSGVNHPHIITHLFMDGGRILKSVKKSYAEHVGTDNMSETVRVMMKEQHKAMFIALRDGQFDALVDGAKTGSGAVKAAAAPPKAPAPKEPPPEERSVVMLPESTSDDSLTAVKVNEAVTAPPPAPAKAAPPPSAKTPPPPSVKAAPPPSAKAPPPPSVKTAEEEPPATVNEAPKLAAAAVAEATQDEDSPSQEPIVSVGSEESVDDLSASEAELVAAEPASEPAPSATRAANGGPSPAPAPAAATFSAAPTSPAPPSPIAPPAPLPPAAAEPRRPSAAELTLDFDALERDTSVGMNAIYKNSDLPPPPAALFAKHEAGTYRATEQETHSDSIAAASTTPRRSELPPRRSPPPPPSSRGARPGMRPSTRPSESRYAPARPAAIFGASTKPAPSIFSDELLTDKSLDEVILSYLAEDLDPPRRK